MLTVCILFGGASSEYEVSLCSAASVLRNIDKTKYQVLPLGITRDGKWLLYQSDNYDAIENNTWMESEHCITASIVPDRSIHGILTTSGDIFRIDCVFPVLHGINGEDGSMQGLFEIAGIPYVGCGVAASANAMDKTITKLFAATTGVRQAKWLVYTEETFFADEKAACKTLIDTLKLPIFVKPACTGSSVGVTKAKSETELVDAMHLALQYGHKVLFEETIIGQEVECAVLGDYVEVTAATPGEVCPTQEFYSYDAKYNDESSSLYIPARIPEASLEEVRNTAVRIFKALDGFGLSRVDFFVEKDGGVVFNEINTIPGFTKISMYPKMFAAYGIPYPELIDRLIILAMER